MRSLVISVLTLALLLGASVCTYAFSDEMKDQLKGKIVLYVNESKAYIDGNENRIDSGNTKVRPVLVNNNTLLPLRFTAESLKAQVEWDAKTSTATLSLNGKTTKIKTGSNIMYINGKEKKISVPAKTIEERLFIPLRAIAEAFDKKVFWDNRGLIIISDKEKPLNNEDEIFEVFMGKYDNTKSFSEGLAAVKKDGKWGYINNTGKEVIELKYDDAGYFREDMAAVKEDEMCSFINRAGNKVLELKYDNAEPFYEGLAGVEKDKKRGFIDKVGKEVTDLKYDDTWPFSEGMAAVKKDGKWGYIDKTGKEVIELKYDFPGYFIKGIAPVVKEGKAGYIDKAGKEVIEFKYDNTGDFVEGLAAVAKDNKWGFIDNSGKEVIEIKYDYANPFFAGKAFVGENGRSFYINKEGKEVDENGEIIETSTNAQTIQSNNLENEEKTMLKIETSKGDIQIEVYPELMPITTENFLSLVKNGFYNDLTFHRVEDWVIQGGDPKGDGTGGSEKTIKLETSPKLKNMRGAVAMARAVDPNSASSQFYILKTDASWLDGNYAVFGNVISGMDIVDNIAIGDKMIKVEEKE